MLYLRLEESEHHLWIKVPATVVQILFSLSNVHNRDFSAKTAFTAAVCVGGAREAVVDFFEMGSNSGHVTILLYLH